MVAMKIFFAGKASHFNSDKGKKVSQKEQGHKDQKGNGKKKEKGAYQGSNCLSTEELEKYRKENRASSVVRRVIHTALAPTSMLRRNFHLLATLSLFILLMMLFWGHHGFIVWLPS